MHKIPLIWNITQACPWNCSFCCINAYYLPLSSVSLETELEKIKKKKIELLLEDKLRIVDNLDIQNIDIDVSGGEPLLFSENRDIIKRLSKKFGRNKISITTTGKGLGLVNINILKEIVGEIGFTYDFPYEPNFLRPKGYNSSNLEQIKRIVRVGIKTMAQIPLTKLNVDKEIITNIYRNLTNVEVNRLHLMKFFPVGRGAQRLDLSLTDQEYQTAIKEYKKLEQSQGPKVYVQTALRNFRKNSSHFNITSQGLLLSDPWAYDGYGKPKSESILGDLKYQKFSKIAKL